MLQIYKINRPNSAIEAFVCHCRKLIQNGPILLGQIERVHSEAISLSETIQSLGSGKLTNEFHLQNAICTVKNITTPGFFLAFRKKRSYSLYGIERTKPTVTHHSARVHLSLVAKPQQRRLSLPGKPNFLEPGGSRFDRTNPV